MRRLETLVHFLFVWLLVTAFDNGTTSKVYALESGNKYSSHSTTNRILRNNKVLLQLTSQLLRIVDSELRPATHSSRQTSGYIMTNWVGLTSTFLFLMV